MDPGQDPPVTSRTSPGAARLSFREESNYMGGKTMPATISVRKSADTKQITFTVKPSGKDSQRNG